MNKIEKAHQMYRDGNYEEALEFYTEALSIAKTNPQKIALHSNRAACFLKLHHFKKAADECTSVLELDYEHTGALMLRAQTLVTLKEYHSALFDVNRLIELNPSSEVYQNLEARLKTQVSLAPIPEAETELEEEDGEDDEEHNKDDEQSASLGLEGTHSHDLDEPASKNVVESVKIHITAPETQSVKEAIPKPKGHSRLDYSRWDKVEDDSSEDDDDDDDDSQPQYRFRVKNIGVRSVK
ncbi:hypothetical protein SSX86_011026 [Deinandra increscens subsp. villosa]|uniref:Uncharacterized protein n=1 Tax=Deinandra increscens subsp. villosa TaxID=3103831 RepID=A0AAP0D926_9ASTR